MLQLCEKYSNYVARTIYSLKKRDCKVTRWQKSFGFKSMQSFVLRAEQWKLICIWGNFTKGKDMTVEKYRDED